MLFRIKNINFALVIDLDRHIEILLLKSDCVIVPGLGGFVASHVAARYDAGDKMFIPPLRTLGFNPKLSVNDSLLVQSYSDAYDMSYPDALARIEKEVEELRQHVQNAGFYELNDIGVLSFNGDGNWDFRPCEAGILTPGLYGLSSFDMDMNTVPVAKGKDILPDLTSVTFEINQDARKGTSKSDGTEPKRKTYGDKSVRIKISALRNFVAAVIAVVLFLALGTPLNEGFKGMSAGNVAETVVGSIVKDGYENIVRNTNSVRPAQSCTVVPSKKTDVRPVTENASTRRPVAGIVKPKADEPYYCIVLASKVSEANAEAFVKRLKEDGFTEARVLVGNNKSVKVVYGRYDNQSKAYNELNNLKGEEYFYEAWVYHVTDTNEKG